MIVLTHANKHTQTNTRKQTHANKHTNTIMPAVYRRDRKKAEKAQRAGAPVWLRKSHQKEINNYFDLIKEELVNEGHVHDDDDDDFLHALVGETLSEQCLSLDLPEFMENLALALHEHAVRMKKLVNKEKREMGSTVFTYANKLVDYLCDEYPQYQHEIPDNFLTGMLGIYEEEYGDEYDEW